jgi:hypothetical protein
MAAAGSAGLAGHRDATSVVLMIWGTSRVPADQRGGYRHFDRPEVAGLLTHVRAPQARGWRRSRERGSRWPGRVRAICRSTASARGPQPVKPPGPRAVCRHQAGGNARTPQPTVRPALYPLTGGSRGNRIWRRLIYNISVDLPEGGQFGSVEAAKSVNVIGHVPDFMQRD